MKNQDEGNYSINDNQYPKVGIFIIKNRKFTNDHDHLTNEKPLVVTGGFSLNYIQRILI